MVDDFAEQLDFVASTLGLLCEGYRAIAVLEQPAQKRTHRVLIVPIHDLGTFDAVALDVAFEPRLARNIGGRCLSFARHGTHDVSNGVGEQVERVFDGATTPHRARIQCDTQTLRQQPSGLRHFDAALESQTLFGMQRQSKAKSLEGTLGERRIKSGQVEVQGGLPPQVKTAALYNLGVRDARIVLQQARHGQQ